MNPSIGVVIPAWNEELALPLLLENLLRQEGVAVEAVVVANGCSDRTAAVGRGYAEAFRSAGHKLTVIDLPAASKFGALNAGDARLKTFPRAYVDADVVMSPNALSAVAAALAAPEPRLAAPRIRFKRRGTRLADGVAAVMEGIPPFADDLVGGGFYAANRSGRRRWAEFPPLIADDAFVVSRFSRAERIVADAVFCVRFPADDRLLATFTRWELGRRQLAQAGIVTERASRPAIFLAVLKTPGRWAAVLLTMMLKLEARRRARGAARDAAPGWARADG
jgi:glycosyltransferase involved in cell wall biosynthesis